MKIHTIDLKFRGVDGAIASFLVEGNSGLALIECGPESTLPALRAGLAELGFAPSDVRHVLVTHIHFDHAGAAGWWAAQGARVYVHPAAARHLADPERLVESARRVYGDAMDSLWGEIKAVPRELLTEVQDGEMVTAGDLAFTAWDTPGHARHHHCYLLGKTAFTGDVTGVRAAGCRYLSVAGAPPQFDAEAYDRSLRRLEGGGLETIYLTHFGAVEGAGEVEAHLRRYRALIRKTTDWVAARLAEGVSGEALAREYETSCRVQAREEGVSDADWERYEAANPCAMSADGIALYWEKRGGVVTE